MTEKIWGRHPVLEALKGKQTKVEKIFIAKGSDKLLEEIRVLAKSYSVEVDLEDRKRLDVLAGTSKHQGVMAIVTPAALKNPVDLLLRAKHLGEPPFFLILDHLQDPHNLGALLRSADACGCHGVVIPNIRSVGLTDTVSKVSAGASSHVPVALVSNINQTIEFFKKEGIWIAGADVQGTVAYYDHDFSIPTALVLGGEGKGISALTREKCDFLLKIPMRGSVASLNVSVAGAVLMYDLLRQRISRGIIKQAP